METTNLGVPKIPFEEFINDTKKDLILESFRSNGLVIVSDVPRLKEIY